MNINRLLGIFIAITVLVWILVFALSPQLKYQKNSNINIPKLPEPSIDLEQLQKIEFNEVKNNSLEIDIKDTLPSAKEKVNKIDKNKQIFVYCHSGVRSYNACKILEQFGFKTVYNLIGGISEWSGKVISKDGS